MYKMQRGMTTIGMILTAGVAGLIVFAGLRLVPVYLEYISVEGVLKSVHAEYNGTNATVQEIRSAISKGVDMNRIEAVKATDFKVSKAGKGYLVAISYSHKVPYIANVSFVVDFEKSVEIVR